MMEEIVPLKWAIGLYKSCLAIDDVAGTALPIDDSESLGSCLWARIKAQWDWAGAHSVLSEGRLGEIVNAFREGWRSAVFSDGPLATGMGKSLLWINCELGEYPELQEIERLECCPLTFPFEPCDAMRSNSWISYDELARSIPREFSWPPDFAGIYYRNMELDIPGMEWYEEFDMFEQKFAVFVGAAALSLGVEVKRFLSQEHNGVGRGIISLSVGGEEFGFLAIDPVSMMPISP